MRGGWPELRDVTAIALVAIAACSSGDEAHPLAPAATPPCVATYPAGPYGTAAGHVLEDRTFDVLDREAMTSRFAFHDAFAPCGPSPQILVVRVQAGFCGTCLWHAAHLGESLGPSLRSRVVVLDLVVRDDDGDPPSIADLAKWRARQDAPALVALDPELRFAEQRASLPRVLVVDPRTMRIREALNDPAPEALADAVAATVADVDRRPAPPEAPVARIDGRFTREQWDMLREMRLFAGSAPRDPTNRFGDDDVASELGSQLFDDKTLSPSGQVSCERCHEKGRTFQDGSETAAGGAGGADRNAPSVVLAAWSRWQLWDGRADTLWMQALLPFEDRREFASSRLFIAHRVYDAYKERYERLFGALPPLADSVRFAPSGKPGDPAWDAMPAADQDAVTQVFVNVGKAVAAFERSFRVTELPFEGYVRGSPGALDDRQKDGIRAFFESGCAQCHWGNRMTDDAFHVLRFPTGRDDLQPDRGRVDGYGAHDASEFRADGRWSDAKIVRSKPANPAMLGGFKTPALRGVAVTGPYGHGGSVPSLVTAVELHRVAGMPEGSRYTTGVAEPWLVDFPADRVESIALFLATLGLGFVR